MHHVDELFTTLGEVGAALNLKKRRFITIKWTILSYHQATETGNRSISRTCLIYVKPQTNTSDLSSLLGLCNVYRHFIPDLRSSQTHTTNL